MNKYKGFIEVTCLSRTEEGMNMDGSIRYGQSEDKVLVNVSDVARVQFGGILTKTPFANGNLHFHTKESYEEIKLLIKEATE